MARLMAMRKAAKEWDPDEQMPWSEEFTTVDDNGKKYKVNIELHPRGGERRGEAGKGGD